MSAARFFASNLLQGDVALVTGGGTGIGKATSIALAQCGARLVIASRNGEHLRQGATEIAAAILFLASPASSWTTGSTLNVTGGQDLYGETWVLDPSSRTTLRPP